MVFKKKVDKKINQQEFKSDKESVGLLLKGRLVLQNSGMGLTKTPTRKIMQKPTPYLD